MLKKSICVLGAITSFVVAAQADITIFSGGANPFYFTIYTGQGAAGGATTNTGGGYFNPGGTSNYSATCIRRMYWGYQLNSGGGSSQVFLLGNSSWDNLNSEDYGFAAGNGKKSVYLSKLGGAANVLKATMTYTVTGVAPTQGYLTAQWDLQNLTSSPLTFKWFSLGALTGNGITALTSNDQATYANGLTTFTNGDPNTPTLYFMSTGPAIANYEVTKSGGTSDPPARQRFYGALSPATPSNTVDVGAGQYAALYQYDITIPANQTLTGQTILGYNAKPSTSVTVSGNINLGSTFFGAPSAYPVTIELRAPGSTTPIETKTVTLDANGNYSFTTSQQGTFDLAAKASHWLRKVNGSVVIGASGVASNNYALVNGDVDGNNAVSITDYAVLSDAFNTTQGDAAYVANADLDGNGAVSITDYAILSDNFNKAGDN